MRILSTLALSISLTTICVASEDEGYKVPHNTPQVRYQHVPFLDRSPIKGFIEDWLSPIFVTSDNEDEEYKAPDNTPELKHQHTPYLLWTPLEGFILEESVSTQAD